MAVRDLVDFAWTAERNVIEHLLHRFAEEPVVAVKELRRPDREGRSAAIPLTRMPSAWSSRATAFVRLMTPALAAT